MEVLTAQLLNPTVPFQRLLETRATTRSDARPQVAPSPPRTLQIQHRLETQQILELIAAYLAGTTIQALSRQFAIHPHTVRNHLNRNNTPLRPNGRILTDIRRLR